MDSKHQRIVKDGLVIAALLGLCWVSYLAIYTFINWNSVMDGVLCEDIEYRRFPSPDGKMVAIVFERDCMMSNQYTEVSIARTGIAGLFFEDHVSFVSDEGQIRSIAVSWRGNRTLYVPMISDPLNKRRVVDGVRILYLND